MTQGNRFAKTLTAGHHADDRFRAAGGDAVKFHPALCNDMDGLRGVAAMENRTAATIPPDAGSIENRRS